MGRPRVRSARSRDLGNTIQGIHEVREAFDQYEALVDLLIPDLPPTTEQKEALDARPRIRSQVDHALAKLSSYNFKARSQSSSAKSAIPSRVWPSQGLGQKYLGEVSDVRFFNVVKRILQTQNGSAGSEQEFDNYEQDDMIPANTTMGAKGGDFHGLEASQQFIDVYFSTIHLAYPFIPQSSFMKTYRRVRDSVDEQRSLDATNLALICLSKLSLLTAQTCLDSLPMLDVICAIGAYYTCFPGKESGEQNCHEFYFVRALSLAPPPGVDRSVNQVSLLLAECFYLLSTCRTDR